MTTSIATEARRRVRPKAQRVTAEEDMRTALLTMLERTTGIHFPDPYWWDHPVEFFERILGVSPWSRQAEIIEAPRDHERVAVRSGHKVSKSHSLAGIAACFYCSFEAARVVMSSTTARQVDQILWRELRMMRARAGRCVACKTADPEGHRIPRPCPHSAIIEGEMGMLARTGLKSDDFREIVGFTAREAEAVAGISGSRLLYLLDEASGIPDEIFEAIEGNRAGGARIVLFSNPTKTMGEFFEAFHSKSEFYHCIQVSSEETPNVVSGKRLIPGLAERSWVEEKKREWGEESPMYKVRIKGEFPAGEDGKIFSIHVIAQAEERWTEDACDVCDGSGSLAKAQPCTACGGTGHAPGVGRLFLGLDPAGPTGSGDETVFCARRGLKMLELNAHLGLSADAHVVHVLSLLSSLGQPREVPVVVVDREGEVGWNVYRALSEVLDAPEHLRRIPFELVGVRSSDRAFRQPMIYERVRDELAANLEAWFRAGGMILEDTRLARDLHVLEWEQSVTGKLKLTPKKTIRKLLGRSPDRYDALSLACFEPLSLQADAPPAKKRGAIDDDDGPGGAMDPYSGGIDPYGAR